MKRYVFVMQDLNAPGDTVSPTFTLKALLNETDFSDQEVDTIASLMVGDTFVLEDYVHAATWSDTHYLAVRRVGEAL